MGEHCEETLREIERFLDGEVDVRMRVEIEEHLVDCPPCMHKAEFRRHLKLVVSSKCGGDQVPPELARRIHDLIQSAGRGAP
jgi:mycothiol system anti-sigma-R factor